MAAGAPPAALKSAKWTQLKPLVAQTALALIAQGTSTLGDLLTGTNDPQIAKAMADAYLAAEVPKAKRGDKPYERVQTLLAKLHGTTPEQIWKGPVGAPDGGDDADPPPHGQDPLPPNVLKDFVLRAVLAPAGVRLIPTLSDEEVARLAAPTGAGGAGAPPTEEMREKAVKTGWLRFLLEEEPPQTAAGTRFERTALTGADGTVRVGWALPVPGRLNTPLELKALGLLKNAMKDAAEAARKEREQAGDIARVNAKIAEYTAMGLSLHEAMAAITEDLKAKASKDPASNTTKVVIDITKGHNGDAEAAPKPRTPAAPRAGGAKRAKKARFSDAEPDDGEADTSDSSSSSDDDGISSTSGSDSPRSGRPTKKRGRRGGKKAKAARSRRVHAYPGAPALGTDDDDGDESDAPVSRASVDKVRTLPVYIAY